MQGAGWVALSARQLLSVYPQATSGALPPPESDLGTVFPPPPLPPGVLFDPPGSGGPALPILNPVFLHCAAGAGG